MTSVGESTAAPPGAGGAEEYTPDSPALERDDRALDELL
jgi:hypothetical protein